MTQQSCEAHFSSRLDAVLTEALAALGYFFSCFQGEILIGETGSVMDNKTDRENILPTKDDTESNKVVTRQPIGNEEQNKYTSGEEVSRTLDAVSCKKGGRCRKRVRFNGSVTVVLVDYKEDGFSVVRSVSRQLLKDGADADTGHAPYRTSSYERLHPISKYLCFGK